MVSLKVSRIFKNIKSSNKNPPPVPDAIWTNPLYFVAFGFGSGAMPIAPGTFGTLLAIPFYLLLSKLSVPYYLVTLFFIIVFSSWGSGKLSNEIHLHDHPGMNIDEFVGFFVTMIAVPPSWSTIILGFIFFRIFDILKPWPVSYVDQHMESGFGMILDDILAGVYSCILLHILLLMGMR